VKGISISDFQKQKFQKQMRHHKMKYFGTSGILMLCDVSQQYLG